MPPSTSLSESRTVAPARFDSSYSSSLRAVSAMRELLEQQRALVEAERAEALLADRARVLQCAREVEPVGAEACDLLTRRGVPHRDDPHGP